MDLCRVGKVGTVGGGGGGGPVKDEHHAHQRVSGELQIQSNLSPTKLNFVGLAKNKSTGARRGGGRVSCKDLGYAVNGH